MGGRTDRDSAPAWLVAALSAMVILVTHGFGNSLVPALLPRIADSFQAGYGVLGLAVGGGLAAYGFGAAVGTRVLDRFPAARLLVLSLAVNAAGFLMLAAAQSPMVLALCVVVIGVAAPISWAATVHVIGRAVRPSMRGRVMAVASAGAGLGSGVNGLFVLVLAAPGSWRMAFVIAAALAVLLIGAFVVVFGLSTSPAEGSAKAARSAAPWKSIWSVPSGRVVIVTSLFAGIGGFTFAGYLSEIAVDELMVSPLAAAAPWWLASSVGLALAVPLGALADRGSAVGVIAMMAGGYALCLSALALEWSYPTLLVATLGFGAFNFPLWGLLGLEAHRGLPTGLALRAVSGGLVVAAFLAMGGITLAGWWIDRAGSFRGPAMALSGCVAVLAIWLLTKYLAEVRAR